MNSNSAIIYISPALFPISEQGNIEQEIIDQGSLVPSEDNQLLPPEILMHIFNFYKRMAANPLPFLLTSKQWYIIAMSDPFIRLAQAVFRVNQNADLSREVRVNCTDMWPSSPMTAYEFHRLLKLDEHNICLERIFHSNLQLFSEAFRGYFHPLLHKVRWDPTHFATSEDPEISALGLNHLAFYELIDGSVQQLRKSLIDGTIDWNNLYEGAINPNAPQSTLCDSNVERKLELLMAELSASEKDRPHILAILKMHGLAIKNAPEEVRADLEAAFIAVEQNPLAFNHVNPSLHIHRDLVLTVVKQYGCAYSKLTNHLCYDMEVLATALNNNLIVLEQRNPFEKCKISFYSLRQLAKDLSYINIGYLINQEPEADEESLLQKCLHTITLLPHIQNIEDQDLRREAIVRCAHRWSRLAAGCLNKLLPMYQEKAGCPLKRILSNLEECLLQKTYGIFKADLRNATFGKFLHCINEKGQLEELTTDPDLVTAKELHVHFKHLLIFFMESVELDPSSPECLEILEFLNDLDPSASNQDVLDKMDKVLDRLEYNLIRALEHAKATMPETIPSTEKGLIAWKVALSGSLKLYPLLKSFNRAFIIDLHTRMIILNRLLGDSRKIVTDYGNLPDHETKSLTFTIKGGEIVIQVKRLGHLLNYKNCSIQSEVLMHASVQDLSDWDIGVRINIARPTEGDELFERDYTKFLELLDFMGLPYKETFPY